MKITKEEVDHVAKLARLSLSDEEKEKLTHQLDDILNYFEQLKELDTSKIEPMAHLLPVINVLREDKVTNQEPSPIVFQNAPSQEDHLFKVPPVIE